MGGKFITVYGINNIGKSTHAKRLTRRLKAAGIDAVYVKYPVYELEPTGVFINQVLRAGVEQNISEEELQMWFALNRYQYQPTLNDHLAAGTWVIAEDYIGTGLAWGVAKGADLEWLEEIHKYLRKEDFSIMLEGQRDLRARETGHIHENDDDLALRCQEVHRDLAERYNWKTVNVQPNFDETENLVWESMSKKFGFL